MNIFNTRSSFLVWSSTGISLSLVALLMVSKKEVASKMGNVVKYGTSGCSLLIITCSN